MRTLIDVNREWELTAEGYIGPFASTTETDILYVSLTAGVRYVMEIDEIEITPYGRSPYGPAADPLPLKIVYGYGAASTSPSGSPTWGLASRKAPMTGVAMLNTPLWADFGAFANADSGNSGTADNIITAWEGAISLDRPTLLDFSDDPKTAAANVNYLSTPQWVALRPLNDSDPSEPVLMMARWKFKLEAVGGGT